MLWCTLFVVATGLASANALMVRSADTTPNFYCDYDKTTCKKALKCPKGQTYVSKDQECYNTVYVDGRKSTTCTPECCCMAKEQKTKVKQTNCKAAKVQCPDYCSIMMDVNGQSVPCTETYQGNKLISTTCTTEVCCAKPPTKVVPCNTVVMCNIYYADASGKILTCEPKPGSPKECSTKYCCKAGYSTGVITTYTKTVVVTVTTKATSTKPTTTKKTTTKTSTVYVTSTKSTKSTTKTPTTKTKTEIVTATSTVVITPPAVTYKTKKCTDTVTCPPGSKYISKEQKCTNTYQDGAQVSTTCTTDMCCVAKENNTETETTNCLAAGVKCPEGSYMLCDNDGYSVPCTNTYKKGTLKKTTCNTKTCCSKPKKNKIVPCNEAVVCAEYYVSNGAAQTCNTKNQGGNACTEARCCKVGLTPPDQIGCGKPDNSCNLPY